MLDNGGGNERLELSPIRLELVAAGWFGLLSHGAGLLVSLPFVDRTTLTLALFGANVVLFGVLSLLAWRYALRRVVAPPPPQAVLVPERLASSRRVLPALATLAVIVAVVAGLLNPAILGIGFGGAIGLLWSARKVRRFERDDGRRVFRRVGRRSSGEPYLFAGP